MDTVEVMNILIQESTSTAKDVSQLKCLEER